MGSGSSRPRSQSQGNTKVNRTKRRLASLICGASSSRDAQSNDAMKEMVLESSDGTEFTTPKTDSGALSEISSEHAVNRAVEDGFREVESSSGRKLLSEGNGSASARQVDLESRSRPQRLSNSLSLSCSGEQSSESAGHNLHAINDVDNSVEINLPHNVEQPEIGSLSLGPFDDVMESGTSNPALVSGQGSGSQPLEDNVIHEMVPSGLGFLLSDRAQGESERNLVQVDVVSIDSSSLPGESHDISTHEARRNNRSTLWETLTNRSSTRHTDFSTLLLTTENADSLGSQRRWLLDIGGSFVDDGIAGDIWEPDRRSSLSRDRRWRLRSELLAGQRSGLHQGGRGESGRRNACPLGLHPDGLCSCPLDDASSARSSISRIVMLAEALFEVLDELYRQPAPFSVLSRPAPRSLVDSLPLKTYERLNACESGDDVEQCYICLSEYELGDSIRVLPCNHEYHVACVDKWLKEIHGVCPLCRRDVGQGSREYPDMPAAA